MTRSRSKLHALATALFLLGPFAACGGKVGGGPGQGGGGGGGGGGGSSGGGGSCVTVQASSLSRSCATAADCALVRTGTICSDSCNCGDTPISTSALAQYDADIASITFGEACPCALPGVVECVNGTCTLCDSPGTDGCGVSSGGGVSPEAGVCVDLEPSMFDTSCTNDSDCVDVTLGKICDSECLCGGSAINVADEAKYNQLVAAVPPGEACGCPFLGTPRCVANQCIVCGGAAPPHAGCPDAGP